MEHAARGAAALSAGKYDEAIDDYTRALAEHPRSPDYYVKRSTAYQRASQYEPALRDAEVAVVLGVERGKREVITQAQLRRAIALYLLERYGDAKFILNIVRWRDAQEKSLPIWEKKVEDKLASLEEGDERANVTVQEVPDIEIPTAESNSRSAASSKSSQKTANKEVVQTPPDKIKHDWYQNNVNVYFTLLAKGVPKDKANIDIQERSLTISFPTQSSSTYDFSLEPLFASIDKSESSYIITPNKVEIILRKKTPGVKWRSLEGDPAEVTAEDGSAKPTIPQAVLTSQTNTGAPSYPTSSRSGPKDWDKLAQDLTKKPKKDGDDDNDFDDLDDDGGDPANAFFKKLYASADPDTRRAMMKSYQESNGTALSTNWAEVSKGKVETSPPDGMVAKKWGE